jgi:putative ABC transport system permease protein
MILWKFTFREIKSRPGRATLTLLSIVIGVAAVVAVTVGTATTNEAFKEMYASVAGRAAFEVVAAGESSFDENVLAGIEKVPGVKVASPTVQRATALRFGDNRVELAVMGVDLARDKAVRDYELAEGRFFVDDKNEAMLEVGLARGIGLKVGDQVKISDSRARPKSFKVVGLLSPRGVAGFRQGNVAFLPLLAAQRNADKDGEVNVISVVLADGVDENKAREVLEASLPQGLTIRSPEQRSQLSKEMTEKVKAGLDLAYVTIIALAFVTILNTFLMNVGERRRQLAVLRAIGTTRRQLIKMLLTEGLVMGVVGTLIGTACGLGGAYLLTQSMGKVYATTMPALRVTPAPFIVAGLLGPIVSLLAMFIPAWIAGRVSPLEGMRFIVSERHRRIPLWYAALSIAAFLATGSIVAACILSYLPTKWVTIVGVLFTVSFLLLIPMILRPLARLVTAALHPLLRTEGRIAGRQVLRRVVRTSLTVGILYVAVSTAISLGTNILDTVTDIHTWTDKTLRGDFIVRATKKSASSGMALKMPESYMNELRAIEGVADVDSLQYVINSVEAPNLAFGKQAVRVFIRDFTGKGQLPLDIRDGDESTLRERLAAGEVVLGTNLAHRIGVGVGDNVVLDTCKGPKPCRVAATATCYMEGGMIVYMEGKTARRLLNVEGINWYFVNAKPGMRPAVGEQVKRFCDQKGLMLQSFAELQKQVDDMTRGVIGGLWGLLVLGLIVGAFAVANTLTMNVLEQTRELALLRVVAMTRWQVRKSIIGQALTIGLIGILTGVVGGMVGAYVMNLCQAQLLGHAPQFSFHVSLLIGCVAIGLVVILAAALVPAERAARLKLLIALQYE